MRFLSNLLFQLVDAQLPKGEINGADRTVLAPDDEVIE
jgi:hypothetical protein